MTTRSDSALKPHPPTDFSSNTTAPVLRNKIIARYCDMLSQHPGGSSVSASNIRSALMKHLRPKHIVVLRRIDAGLYCDNITTRIKERSTIGTDGTKSVKMVITSKGSGRFTKDPSTDFELPLHSRGS
jgi:hypothetical protein